MTVQSKPNDIARETLRLLITRKEAPTPENYGRLYCEIAGDDDTISSGVSADRLLQRLAAELPRTTPELVRLANTLANARSNRSWDEGHRALLEFAKLQGDSVSSPDWTALLRELARHLCEYPTQTAERRAAIDRALHVNGTPVQMSALYRKLLDLTNAWAKAPALISSGMAGDAPDGEHADAFELRELLAQTLEIAIAAPFAHTPALGQRAGALADQLRARDACDLKKLRSDLRALLLDVELRGSAGDGVQTGLLALLRLLIENVGELVSDDQWLRGQISILLQVISGPLDLIAIEEAQRNLKNVIRHQTALRASLNTTKTTLKQMVASFIDELGKLSTATGDYHDSIENLAQQIRQTEDVTQLNTLLEEVMRETRSVQASALRSREEVLRAREQVSVAELKIRELESQLEEVSSQALRDHLTGTLNRRGLSETFEREISVADRGAQPLSVALLDIDNFKDFNDTLGHQAGDDALVHLADVIRDTMRPSDSVARYGGEEFIILLPNTNAEQGSATIMRLQRELTKRFFLHDNRKVLITFSAGVATYQQGDTQQSVIDRADRALYAAKRAGKNRVVGG